MGHKRKHYDKTHSADSQSSRSKRKNRDADRYDDIDEEDLVYGEYAYDEDFDDADMDRSGLEQRFQSRTHGPSTKSKESWGQAPSTDDEEWDDFGFDYLRDFNDAS